MNTRKPPLTRAHEDQEAIMPAQEATQNCVLLPESTLPRRKIAKRLHEILTDEDLSEAVSAIRQSLKAKKSSWDGVAKKMVVAPDYKIQIDAAKTILAYREGMPIQRQVVVSEAFESLRDAIIAAEHSPEARKLIETGLLG
jgi:hypothetical protein